MAEISTIARPYAIAVFQLAKGEKKLAVWSDLLSLLSGLVKDVEFRAYLEDTKILDSDRESALMKCVGDIDEHGKNFIKLLIENKRLMVIPHIFNLFEELKDSEEGTMEAQIIVAEKPEAAVVKSLIASLEKKFNRKIESNLVIDKSIIGGTKIIVGDTVIDASVKGQLNSLAYSLKS
ncbi:MAG: F0F1 ATP synthase subunit delta [Methylophilaceae bacterium]|jgi:F-type H+-transporting ATPase subunit delta|nr:F0F1 ATP synthase subunit delta [Methylophilaceae bacterium]MBL6726642.1 F0F1 ATP synthase subunit delta [Methylophilaceae bacterium]MBL6790495.1 F0F1 ATP synthase subunit delta [Methylophilaceae bacterium]